MARFHFCHMCLDSSRTKRGREAAHAQTHECMLMTITCFIYPGLCLLCRHTEAQVLTLDAFVADFNRMET